MNRIAFACLGFSSTSVFVIKDGMQIHVGFVSEDSPTVGNREFTYFGVYERDLSKDEIPSPEQVLVEYEKQLKEKGVWINDEIKYAG